MAETRRGFVWLVCETCNSRNYRVERRLRMGMSEGGAKQPMRNMDTQQRLTMRKFCKRCRQQMPHVESRKK